MVLAFGLFKASSIVVLFSYLLVVAVSIVPTYLWARLHRPGIPIVPAMGLMSILYYAIPLVRGRQDLIEYTDGDLLLGAATVSLFLLASTGVSHFFLRQVRRRESFGDARMSATQMKVLIFLGLGLGMTFLGAAAIGLLGGLGSYFGFARSIALTSLVASCYFLGVARGRRVLHGRSWILALFVFGLVVLIAWSSLYLVGGMTFLVAAAIGYVTTKGKVPWLPLGIAVVLVSILHAGKEEMRDRYWQQEEGSGRGMRITELPQRLTEWFELGLESLSSDAKGRSALDRASLLQMLLRVQRLTPSMVDYLRGDTYALIPEMLIPRFLNPEKPISKAGLDMLSIRYGLMSQEGLESTTIGWGLIAEAFANFGFAGVGLIGLLIGLLGGIFGRWSASGSAVSVSTLMAVAAMLGLINLEQDLASLVTSLVQSSIAVLFFVALVRLVLSSLGGHLKSGHLSTCQNRPFPAGDRDG